MTASRTRPTLARLLGAALVVGSLLTTQAVLLAPGAEAATNGAWSVEPATPKGTGNARQFIFLEVKPGQTVRDAVVVQNKTKNDKIFTIFAADAYNAANTGAFSLTTAVDKPADVGTWVTINPPGPKITVKPGKSVTVPFTMKVPTSATPGDHVGGIVALDNQVTVGGDNPNVRVDVQNAVGVRLYTRVAGPLTPSLAITDYKLSTDAKKTPFSSGKSTVTFTVKNTGNVRITPKAKVTLTGLFGRDIDSVGPTTINEVLPGGSATLTTTVPDSTFIGPLHARLDLTSPETSVGADATTWVIPWWLVIVILILIIGGVVWRRRKSGGAQPTGGRRRAGSSPTPAPVASGPAASGPAGGPVV